MSILTPEIMAQRSWLNNFDPGVSPAINYPYFPVYEILRISANVEADKIATWFYGTEINFWDLQLYAIRFANALIEAGIKKGDRVGLMLPTSPQFVIAFWGLLHAGAIIVNVNPQYTKDELKKIVDKTGMTGIITIDQVVPVIRDLSKEVQIPFVLVTRMSDFVDGVTVSTAEELGLEPGWFHYSQFLDQSSNEIPPGLDIDPEDPAVIQFTGGTTGAPKGATLTHYNLVVASYAAQEFTSPILGLYPVPRRHILAVLPYCHIYGEICALCIGAISRSTQILLPKFDLDEVMDTISKFDDVTYFPAVPTMINAVINHPRAKEIQIGRRLGVFNSGAAPCPPELLKKARDMNIFIAEGWGMSETTSLGITNPYMGRKKEGSIGSPYPDVDIRIMDPQTGEEAAIGEPGEIVLRSPTVMKGYWNDPEETAKVLRDGWLYTGDLAYKDEDGYFFIVDRSKDVVISGGFNIYPREIDEVLFAHPKVKDAMAVGIPDGYYGEILKAFVQVVDGVTVTEEELKDHCRKHLAGYKVPRKIEFRSELPRSAVGKALRRILRDEEIAKMAEAK